MTCDNVGDMAKEAKGKAASAYRSVGTTYDGVRILKPKTKPKSFTTGQIRATIRQVLRDRQSNSAIVKREQTGSDKSSSRTK